MSLSGSLPGSYSLPGNPWDIWSNLAWAQPTRSGADWKAEEELYYGTIRASGRTKFDPYLLWVDDGWKFRARLGKSAIQSMAADQVDSRAIVLVISTGYAPYEDWIAGYTSQGCAVLVDYRHEYENKQLQVMVTRDPAVIVRHARVGGNFALIASYEPLYHQAAGMARAGFQGLGGVQGQTLTIPLPPWPAWLPPVPVPAQVYEWLNRVVPGAEIPTKRDVELAQEEKSSWVVPVVGAVVGISLLGIFWAVTRRK